jgi:hypothetical protein
MVKEDIANSDESTRIEFQEFDLKSLREILGDDWVFNETQGIFQFMGQDGLWEILVIKNRPESGINDSVCVQRDSLIMLELVDIEFVDIRHNLREAYFYARNSEGDGGQTFYRILDRGYKHQVESTVNGAKIRGQCPVPGGS